MQKNSLNQQTQVAIDNQICPIHLPHGIPQGTPATNDFIVRDIYCLSSNDETKFADYVAYRLDKQTITGSSSQDRNWKADPAIAPEETLEPEDYDGAYKAINVDRGHLAPLASFKGKNWSQVNYLSNIVPQQSELNRTYWKNLEDYVRNLVRKYGEVYVITGTAYQGNYGSLPKADEDHKIPTHLWKIVMYDGKLEAYLFPQNKVKWTDFKTGKTTLALVEEYSGLELSFLLKYYQE